MSRDRNINSRPVDSLKEKKRILLMWILSFSQADLIARPVCDMENEFCSQSLHKDSYYPKVIWQLPTRMSRPWPNKLPRGFPPRPHFSSVSIHEADDFHWQFIARKTTPFSEQPTLYSSLGLDHCKNRSFGAEGSWKALVRQLPRPPEKPVFEKCNPWKLRRIRKIHVPITYFTGCFVEIIAFVICWRVTWVCS